MDKTAWLTLGRALALVLVFEGIGPFIFPTRWRQTMLRMSGLDERVLRTMGFLSMLVGLVWLRVLGAFA